MTKGILKRHSLSGVSVASSNSDFSDSAAQRDSPKTKRVSFDGAEPARVFEADDWDRSPAEVTLRLTYKDVIELRELDVSLVRTGPLMMERTPSRRPTRQRTLKQPPSTQPSESFSPNSSHGGSPIEHHNHPDEIKPRPSIVLTPSYPRLSPLPPLLEDASSPASSPSPTERRIHGVVTSDSYFTFRSASPSGSPPGLSVRSPRLRALPSPTLVPPSPLTLSPPLFPRSPSPKPSSRSVSPISLYIHPKSGPVSPRFKKQSISDSQKTLVFSSLTRDASVPDELTLEAGKGTLSQASLTKVSPSSKWKPLGLAGIDANSSSTSLSSGKNALTLQPPASPIRSWRNGRSLVGWELKRNGGGSGKLGFGLVRKGSTGP